MADVITTTSLVAATAALVGPVSAAIAVYITKSTEAWGMRYKSKKEAYQEAFELAASQFQAQIDTLKQEVKEANIKLATLEAKHDGELKEVYCKLDACKEEHHTTKLEYEKLKGDFRELRIHVERLWKHDQRNEKQLEENLKALQRLTLGESGGQATLPTTQQ